MRPAHAAEPVDAVDYLTHIKPVLTERCYACHGALKQEGNLRLDTAELAKKGGDSGPAVEPGDVEASLLLERVSAADPSERMPAEGQPLKPNQIAALRKWIEQDAPAPLDEQPESDPLEHWAFRPVVKPTIPETKRAGWVRNPVDAFIAAKQEEAGLVPAAAASRELLVRRVYLDLVGVPPSAADLARLDADPSSDWYNTLVDRLLEDPRHGERWARHWMDIWRYSDWWGLGDQIRNSQHHMWHWRDWIIESLNENMPYDEMVRLMLAADELHPNDFDKLRATGFLARNWRWFARDVWMEEVVEHVSKGFLGLTMNCAKCHDHKYDPIAQVDFYRLRAFFEPYHIRMDMVPGEPDLARDGIPRAFDGRLDAPTYRFERGQETQPDKSTVITPGLPDFLSFEELEIAPVSLPPEAWQPERRAWVPEAYVSAAKKNVAVAEASCATAKEKLAAATKQLEEVSKSATSENPVADAVKKAANEAELEVSVAQAALDAARAELASVESRATAMRAECAKQDDTTGDSELVESARSLAVQAVVAERQAALAKARHEVASAELKLHKAAADAKSTIETEVKNARDAVAKAEQLAAAKVADTDKYTRLIGAKWATTRFNSSTADDPPVEFPATSTGRRAALAKWITDKRNPLTARVAVNHIWTRHFGTPLVGTVFDFGRKGSSPTHPELLDWLAAEFMDSGWDMKHLHRLMVTSAAYRMSSSTAGADANIARDPDNELLWRRTPIRIEAEAVRDSILSLAGMLDESMLGPPVQSADQAGSTRRSIYFFHSNNDRNTFLTTFDGAGVRECYRREQSILPQQALALSNSKLVHEAASKIAERLSQSTSNGTKDNVTDDREFIREAFYELLAIRANNEEVSRSLEAIEAWRKLSGADEGQATLLARKHFIWALFNHNDFVTLR